MILLDTSGLLSANASSQRHAVRRYALACIGVLAASPFVLSELDYLLAKHVGAAAHKALLDEVARGAYQLEPFGPADVAAAKDVLERYPALRIGLADASVVVLAGRHGTRDVLTLDERHFRSLRSLDRKRFRILPFGA